MIYVLDIGIGNPLAVLRSIGRTGAIVKLATKADDITIDSRVVLPGVGSFDAGMRALKQRGFDEALTQIASVGKGKILGLCLGMQLLFDASEEGTLPGLGLIGGMNRRLLPGYRVRVPHIGWNYVKKEKDSAELSLLPQRPRFYFAHSYYIEPNDTQVVTLSTQHGIEFPAAIQTGCISGAQFHPEKSHAYGLQFMKGFVGE